MPAPTSPVAAIGLAVLRERYRSLTRRDLLDRLIERGVLSHNSITTTIRNIEDGYRKPSRKLARGVLEELNISPREVVVPEAWGDVLDQVAASAVSDAGRVLAILTERGSLDRPNTAAYLRVTAARGWVPPSRTLRREWRRLLAGQDPEIVQIAEWDYLLDLVAALVAGETEDLPLAS
jgi:hypothetical protein